jgi:hypothetical protein
MPVTSVPPEAQAGLEEVLARAIGLAGFDDEKAVIWTVFSHLLQTPEAASIWRMLGDESGGWPSALFWGGEALGEQADYAREQLIARAHGEPWAPDVLLEFWPAGLVMIVARHLKPNSDRRDADWKRWLDDCPAFFDPAAARASGRFDLVRAWRLGWELAERRRMTLINLVLYPERAQQKAATDLFASSLAEKDGFHFRQLTWRALLHVLPPPWPEWFERWAKEKRLK